MRRALSCPLTGVLPFCVRSQRRTVAARFLLPLACRIAHPLARASSELYSLTNSLEQFQQVLRRLITLVVNLDVTLE